MLENASYGPSDTIGETRAERCRPDYEKMIKRIREKLDKSVAFRDAALFYFQGRIAKDGMAELIGELVTECNSLEQEHDALIQAQEVDALQYAKQTLS